MMRGFWARVWILFTLIVIGVLTTQCAVLKYVEMR